MGRYKFPGKPTKNVNKKRVNVLLYATIKTKESVGYSNEFSSAFGIHTNQASTVNGETLLVNTENKEVDISTESCSKYTILTSNANMNKVTDSQEKEYESLSILLSSNNNPNTFMYNYKKFIVRSSALTKTQTRSMKDIKRLIKRKKRILSNVQMHDSSTIKFSPCSNRKSIYARKRQIKDNNRINKFSPRIRDREKTSLVGKFVLPSKSLHSSRLIIPNKRFINNEQIYQTVTKPKQTKKKICNESKKVLKSNEDQKKIETNDNNEENVNDVKVDSDNSSKQRINMCTLFSSENSADMNDVVVIDSSLNSNNPRPSSKLVLRKARLQLNTQSTENMDCPFSNNTLAPSPPGTVTCGVCGAVRFYKFVKQARKFNIYSCESCRKFISKMIKRLASPKNSQVPKLICHKGQGMCHVPPIVRSQQWKLLRCAYKARCPACWLKMCLQSFQMPTQLKTSLINMLPDNMRIIEENPSNNDIQTQTLAPTNLWQPQPSEPVPKDVNQTVIQQESPEKPLDATISSGKIDSLSSRMDTLLNKTKVRHERPRSRLKKNLATTSNNETQQNNDYKRQKLDIKGPRVKHVCRSASIVLGQPLATFSSACSTDNEEVSSGVCDSSNDTDSCIKCKSLSQEHCTEKQEVNEEQLLNTELVTVPSKNICLTTESDCSNVEETYPLKPSITIASDYFDNYDSECKIYGSGFGLIGSEPFSIQAVCFYCGSAGQEQLVYCACCCEPYHCYCINESITQRYFNNFTTQKRKFLWKCSRCSICERCGYADNKKISCKLCQYYFHPDCMQENPKFPMTCSSCLQCEDCGSENITDTILNSLLCLLCLKNRMKEITCSLCKKYDENSSTKMFKCNTCKRFVHTSCENISSEACKILNYLPDPTVLTCCVCSPHKISNWNDSLAMALKNGFHIVIRMLARSRTATEIMKWNLLKDVACSCRPTNNKNIDFDSDVKVLIKANSEKSICRGNTTEDSIKTRTKNKDNNINISLRNMQKKICIKECSVRIKNCLETKDSKSAVFKIDDKCKIKTSDSDKKLAANDIDTKKFCSKHNIMPIVLLLNIKKNINSNLYKSVEEFHFDVRRVLKRSLCLELLKVLDTILKETFPWYDPESLCEENEFRTSMFLNSSHTEQKVSPFTELCSTIISDETSKVISNSSITFDTRTCVLCNKIGDSMPSLQGRLIYCGHNDWIHVNCAFWSSDVYEEIDCSLQNVHETISRSRTMDCSTCKEKGATVVCAADNCSEIYHFMCGRSSNCIFVNSKLMYCYQHFNSESSPDAGVVNGKDFELQRPIYVNIDIQKKKHVELSKVQFLIGSLTVTNLGTFFPPFSDTEEAIIPSEFVCSRLFWSTVEPWKIIKYNISTSVFIPTLKNIYESEKNFTIDHSLPNELIEEQLIEISKWNNEYDDIRNNPGNGRDFQKDSTNITDDDKIVLQVLDHLIEVTCNKEVEDNCDDEPQNSTDILPPELKEAIFEDLPHDLLDGISMQDIFPKLMNYEDVISMDIKSSEPSNINNNNNIDMKTGLNKELLREECFQTKEKKSDVFVNGNDFWMEPTKYSIQNLEDFVHNEKTITENVQQLKRSKSEVLTGFKKLSRTCNHQRSCSLTWSCKLDNNRATNVKKRKLCSSKTVSDIRNNLFMLLDGNSEKCNLQELRLPESILMSVSHPATIDKVRELKYCLEEKTVISGDRFKSHTQEIEQEKENKCRLWRNRARIVQTDGADDSSSSENESDSNLDDFESIKQSSSNTKDEPVQCDRCQCTYRTLSSYKKHLETCDYILSSDSDSEVSVQNEEISNSAIVINNIDNTNISTKTINLSQTVTKTNMQVSVTCSTTESATKISNCDNINSEIICQNNLEIKSEPIDIKPIKEEYISESLLRNNEHVNEIINNVENNTKLVLNAQNLIQQSAIVPEKMINKKVPIFKVSSVQRFSPEKKTNKSNVRRKINDKIIKVQNSPQNQIVLLNNNTRLQEVETNISTTPAVYFQHLPSSNLMPTYVDTFQHQNGQNLQCIATIVANDYKPQQMVTPNIFLPGTIQTTGSNILNIQNTGYQVFPGLESQLQQPTVIGSLVNRPTNFQCGIMSAEQIVLGSIPNIGTIVNDSQNSLCFSSQPILYGFETIVQNTVMSTSQQFASTNLPGMLASNSSYSTTTTQVFHSSKIEPILDINNSGYILLNNSSVPQVAPAQITINQLPQLPPKPQANLVATQLPIMDSQQPYAIQILPVCEPVVPMVEPLLVATPAPPKPEPNVESQICIKTETTKPVIVEPMKPPCTERSIKPRVTSSTTSITLPVASNVNENKIPMNIVSPMPQTTTPSQITKPTNRVLPMQAVSPQKEFLKPPSSNKIIPNNKIPPINKITSNNKIIKMEPPHILNKFSETMEKIQETLQNDVESIQSIKCNKNKNNFLKLESASLKLVFQKQSQDGLYKISNKYVSKNKTPIPTTKHNISKTDENIVTKEKNIEISEKENKIQSKTTTTSTTSNTTNGNKMKINNNPNIVYNVQSQDGFDCSSTSLTDVWKNVFDAVQSARTAHNMPNLPNSAFKVINGLQLLGLKSNGLRYLIEQLPGAGNCMKYKPLCQKRLKYCQYKDEDNKLSFQAARCEPYIFTKQPYDMFSWLASKHRNPDYFNYVDIDSASRRSSVNLPMAMRFRQLKETSKHAVGVYRSSIHGRGLFCLRDIECGEMVIEYAGEVIRSTLTDKREKYYNSKGIGCYMFRVDDNLVVDATMKGNAARFINHSCDPNCYSRVVDILGHKHILIFALRKIIQGEELTYDYKFPFEEDKIPCTCGAKRCRKYLN